ncbi:Ribonuclease H2 subunit C [Penicillium verhagenii]|nr:Ribonuclease H2 subunit C [Penicillium verhagenii]
MPDMYAFQAGSQPSTQQKDESSAPQVTPNILPCQVHHDGPIASYNRFWTPVADAKDNTQSAHFRGRKLRGRRVAVPEGYQGVIAMPTESVLPSRPTDKGDEDVEILENGPEEPVKILETQGTFDEMIVWQHEFLPAADDTFVKGVEEWVRFAETMHATPVDATK